MTQQNTTIPQQEAGEQTLSGAENASARQSATDVLHFEKWIGKLGERKATDLHLTVGNVPMLRIDGDIVPLIEEEILTRERIERIVDYVLSERESALFREQKHVLASVTLKKVMRFRLHAFYSRGYPGISLRHLPAKTQQLPELGLPDIVSEFAAAREGLYVVAGPFDSGKTTTVKAIVSELNRTQSKYIVTLEQPIEYLIPSDKSMVVQREIGRDVGSFSEGLEAIRDEDVNVVVVSNMDDAVVVEKVLQLAGAGRLVIGIMDGRHVVGVLEQLRDLFSEPDRQRILRMLSDTLLGITVQLLLARVGGGRALVTEALRATRPIASLIRENKLGQIPNVMQTSGLEGMKTMDRALVDAVKAGSVSLREAQAHAVDIGQFNLLVSH